MTENNSRSNRLAKNTAFLFLRMALLMLIGFFTSREVLRILGVENLGIYNLVSTLVVMFGFLQSALNNATSRFITFDLGKSDTRNLRKTFSMSMNVELILAVSIVAVMEIVGPWFIGHKLNIPAERVGVAHIVFQLSLLGFALGLIRTPYHSLIIAHERMDFFAYISIVEGILKLLILYLLTIIHFDKLVLYAALIASINVVILLWQYIYCRLHFAESRYVRFWDSTLLRKLCNYSGLSLLVNMCDVAVVQSISIFFNIFSGVVANAALGIANQVNGIFNQFLGNFGQSYWPQIIKSYASGDRPYFMNLIFSCSKLSFFIFFGVSFPILINIDYLLNIWLVTPPQHTAAYLVCIAAYSLLDSFSQPLWQSVHATGNLKVHQMLMGGIKMMNIPVSLCLLMLGAPVISVLMVYAFMNLVCSVVRIWWLTHLIKLDAHAYLREVIAQMLKIVVLTAPVPLFIAYAVDNELWQLILTIASFVLTYPAAIYFLALNQREKDLVVGFLVKARDIILRR